MSRLIFATSNPHKVEEIVANFFLRHFIPGAISS